MANVSSYSHVTTGTIPRDAWDEVWFAVESWKGYLQSFPGLLTVRISARALKNGDIRFYSATVWEYPEQLEAWRESQWSAKSLLLNVLRYPAYDVSEETFEDL